MRASSNMFEFCFFLSFLYVVVFLGLFWICLSLGNYRKNIHKAHKHSKNKNLPISAFRMGGKKSTNSLSHSHSLAHKFDDSDIVSFNECEWINKSSAQSQSRAYFSLIAHNHFEWHFAQSAKVRRVHYWSVYVCVFDRWGEQHFNLKCI